MAATVRRMRMAGAATLAEQATGRRTGGWILVDGVGHVEETCSPTSRARSSGVGGVGYGTVGGCDNPWSEL